MPNQYTAVAIPNTPETAQSLIARTINGETLENIAIEYGVTRRWLNQIILENAAEDWQRTQTALAIERLEVAKQAIDNATNKLQLGKARESAKIAQWELEKLCRRLYGDKLDILHSGDVTINLTKYGSVIEHEPLKTVVNPAIGVPYAPALD